MGTDTDIAADIGVFGGSGFYAFLDEVTEHRVTTPYGKPAAPLHIGTVGDKRVAFMPRHGQNHEHPPHRINYRANLWAMYRAGVGQILAPCASGSLQPDIHPGEFVVCDQLVNRTTARRDTYFDGPDAHHISFADPFCPELRALAIEAGKQTGITVHDGGTVVVIDGPRFSTRAESQWFREMGWHVVNMTQYPEAALARELGICYASIALITDYDTGVEGLDGVEPVTMEEVFTFLETNVDRVRELLFAALAAVPVEPDWDCNRHGPRPDPASRHLH